VPLLHKRVTNRSFNFIIEKVDQRLSKWKAKTLSLAGRLTLAKSVIQAMLGYVMQSTLLPVHICDEIDRKCRNFIWGDTATRNRIHPISWEKLVFLKSIVDWSCIQQET